MTSAQDWIAHDPDPVTAAELASCGGEELARRFAHPLTFGTAGLRGPLRGGPDGMNLAVVLRTTWALAQVLKDRCLGGSPVVVGRDARHGSEEFAAAAAEVLAAEGFAVTSIFAPAPTPVVAFAVRRLGAAAGVQITASHNPPQDNGYKVFVDGGRQIIAPTDREIESAISRAPHADEITRVPVESAGTDLVAAYLERVATVRRGSGGVRVALTPMHGVGGEFALDALALAGIDDVHTVDAQFAPDPDFPTVAFPNPEEPGATDLLLALAADVDADVAIALDPDADRCAVGVRTGRRGDGTAANWRMLTGDETGWLLGDYILSTLSDPQAALVASTVVSSRMLAAIAAGYGARHAETPTGFKWLARAASPGAALVYAYEEAIGHCVDPDAVSDKDGISAAVLICDLVAALRSRGSTLLDALDDLARSHGVHLTAGVSRRVEDADRAMATLRASPPATLADIAVTVEDLGQRHDRQRTDALVFTGDGIRVVVRPSGTEPKLKSYIEVRSAPTDDLGAARAAAQRLCAQLVDAAARW
jgi:phosphomannomutase